MKLNQTLAFIISAAGIGIMGCSNASLYKGQFNAQSTAQINFCTTPSVAVQTNLKYLFVIDQSSSNQQNYLIASPTATPYPDPAGGTDPTGVKRYPPLINFLQNSQPNSHIFYSSLFFNTTPVVPFSNFTGGGATEDTSNDSIWYTGGVQNTAAYMKAQYQNVYCPGGTTPPCTPQGDGGYTDYTDTLNLIYNSIQQDIAYQQTLVAQGQPLIASTYVIFWVSSGFANTAQGIQPSAGIIQQVQGIMNLKTTQQFAQYVNGITFNTGFYTTINGTTTYGAQQAENLMISMAAAGQGAFVNFGTSTIDYSKFTVPQQNEPFILRDLWIQNASTVWWNGQLMLDSDNDGIPDDIEIKWGSNPNAYDSDGNGIGDGVEYYLWGSPCGSIASASLGQSGQSCTAAQAVKSFLAVPGCGNPGAAPNVYPDTDSDYLNDCEEGLLGSSFTDFDSNQDFVPDQFEWLFNVPFVAGTNGLSANPANDGVNDYQKLKYLYPVSSSISKIQQGVDPLTYELTQTSSNNTQTCYNASVQNLATMSNSDVLRVYVMESQGAVGTLRHMRVLSHTTHMNGTSGNIADGDFTP